MQPDKDPLISLGPSLFLSILVHLPYPSLLQIPQVCRSWHALTQSHKSGIWRLACIRSGMEQHDIEMASRRPQPEGTLTISESSDMDSRPTEVDWKDLLKRHISLDRNWRFGRCNEKWVTGGGNAVWRFKIDEEQGTCLMTSRTGGLHVVDLETSSPIFSMRSVRPFAHLEFCKGFAIFDIGSEDLTLQVYRTQPAISRSPYPGPSGPLPREAASSISHAHPTWRPQPTSTTSESEPLPRGHLAFYRKITPPTACRAFRARVDREGTDQERAMLGTAGEEGVYLWDLDDETKKEVVEIPPDPDGEEIGIQYLEFDDDYIFLCGRRQMHVFSRQTKKRILAFPGEGPVTSLCSAAYCLDVHDFDVVPSTSDLATSASMQGARLDIESIVGRQEVPGHHVQDREFGTGLLLGSIAEWVDDESESPAERIMRMILDSDFSACHYTSTDLVCATKVGHLLIIRDYAAVLSISDPEVRLRRWGEQTVIIGLGEPIELLAINRTHVTASTPAHVFFFDTSTLPDLPLVIPDSTAATAELPSLETRGNEAEPVPVPERVLASPSIAVHSILSLHPYGIREASCAQMTKTGIYYTYYAVGELEAGTGRIIQGIRVPEIPERAIDRFGICVRGWDFGVDL